MAFQQLPFLPHHLLFPKAGIIMTHLVSLIPARQLTTTTFNISMEPKKMNMQFENIFKQHSI